MSETRRYTGKIKLLPKLEGEDFQAQCKRILDTHYPETELDDDEHFSEQLFWHSYQEYININTDLYKILDLREAETDEPYCRLIEESDDTFTFDTMFYDGGTNLSEMIEKGFNDET